MTEADVAQLKPGALLCVRESSISREEVPPNELSLGEIVREHGYIFRFKGFHTISKRPVTAVSLATNKEMIFYASELDVTKERD